MKRIFRPILNACVIGSSLVLGFATASLADYGGIVFRREDYTYWPLTDFRTQEAAENTLRQHCGEGQTCDIFVYQNVFFSIASSTNSRHFYIAPGSTAAAANASAIRGCSSNLATVIPPSPTSPYSVPVHAQCVISRVHHTNQSNPIYLRSTQ